MSECDQLSVHLYLYDDLNCRIPPVCGQPFKNDLALFVCLVLAQSVHTLLHRKYSIAVQYQLSVCGKQSNAKEGDDNTHSASQLRY